MVAFFVIIITNKVSIKGAFTYESLHENTTHVNLEPKMKNE